MAKLLSILGVALLLSSIQEAIATPKCKNGTMTAKANFDKLDQGTSPPDGYALLDWHGWTVSAPSAGGGDPTIQPASSPNVLIANDPQLGYMTLNSGGVVGFTITEFYARCYYSHANFGNIPTTCAFQVTGKSPQTYQYSFATMSFEYNGTVVEGQTPKTQKYTPKGGVGGENVYFSLVGPPVGPSLSGDTQLLVDSLVITQSC